MKQHSPWQYWILYGCFVHVSCWCLPWHEGNGPFHCPSSPHISTEFPLRYFPSSHLNVRMWSGSIGLFSAKPFTRNPPSAGGGSQPEAETKKQTFKSLENKLFHQPTPQILQHRRFFRLITLKNTFCCCTQNIFCAHKVTK